MTEQGIEKGFDEIRKLFQETTEKLDRRIHEIGERLDKHIRETDEKLDKLFKERLEKKMSEGNGETQPLFKTDKGFWEDEGPFTTGWSKLIEALVESSTLKLFQERGITGLTQTAHGFIWQYNDTWLRIGPLLQSNDEIVILEARYTLRVEDVHWLLDDLKILLDCRPEFRGFRGIYGGVAGIEIEEGADQFAYEQGLFVLHAMADGTIKILNDSQFKPRNFRVTDWQHC